MTLSTDQLESLKYPIGKYVFPETVNENQIEAWKMEISTLPNRLAEVAGKLSDAELEYIYRPDSWNIRQVIHHCADSHMNAFIRFKLALTEQTPTIKPYMEDKWAELPDSSLPISYSLDILRGLHKRWFQLIDDLDQTQLDREFRHPESGKISPLTYWLGMYAWHGNHHLSHVHQALQSQGKF